MSLNFERKGGCHAKLWTFYAFSALQEVVYIIFGIFVPWVDGSITNMSRNFRLIVNIVINLTNKEELCRPKAKTVVLYFFDLQ